MSDAVDDLYQEIVLEHKRAPRHFGVLEHPTHAARGRNPSCGDDIQVQLQMDGDTISDIRFTGHACAICTASASLMTEAVCGHSGAQAEDLHRRFRAVLTGDLDAEGAALGKLISLSSVRRYPERIKCALLGWHALMHAMKTPAGASGAATTTLEE